MRAVMEWVRVLVLTRSIARKDMDPERGSITVEQVVITAGLALAAILVIGVLTAIITDKVNGISL